MKCTTCEWFNTQQCELGCQDFNPKEATHDNVTMSVTINNKIVGYSSLKDFKSGLFTFKVKTKQPVQLSLF